MAKKLYEITHLDRKLIRGIMALYNMTQGELASAINKHSDYLKEPLTVHKTTVNQWVNNKEQKTMKESYYKGLKRVFAVYYDEDLNPLIKNLIEKGVKEEGKTTPEEVDAYIKKRKKATSLTSKQCIFKTDNIEHYRIAGKMGIPVAQKTLDVNSSDIEKDFRKRMDDQLYEMFNDAMQAIECEERKAFIIKALLNPDLVDEMTGKVMVGLYDPTKVKVIKTGKTMIITFDIE